MITLHEICYTSQFLFLIYTIASVYYRSITNLKIWSDFMNVCLFSQWSDKVLWWSMILENYSPILVETYTPLWRQKLGTNWPVSDLFSNFLILLLLDYTYIENGIDLRLFILLRLLLCSVSYKCVSIWIIVAHTSDRLEKK